MTVKEFVEILKDYPLGFSLYDNDGFGFEMIIPHPHYIEMMGSDLPAIEGFEDGPLTMTVGDVLGKLQDIATSDLPIVASSDYCDMIEIIDITLHSHDVCVHLLRLTAKYEDVDTDD